MFDEADAIFTLGLGVQQTKVKQAANIAPSCRGPCANNGMVAACGVAHTELYREAARLRAHRREIFAQREESKHTPKSLRLTSAESLNWPHPGGADVKTQRSLFLIKYLSKFSQNCGNLKPLNFHIILNSFDRSYGNFRYCFRSGLINKF
jgi:hypothetical protein